MTWDISNYFLIFQTKTPLKVDFKSQEIIGQFINASKIKLNFCNNFPVTRKGDVVSQRALAASVSVKERDTQIDRK